MIINQILWILISRECDEEFERALQVWHKPRIGGSANVTGVSTFYIWI